MSIKYNDKTNNREILLAGISPVDQILNGTSKNAIANKAVYNALKEKIEKTVSDLVNYYSKTDVYNKAEVRALISTISTMDIQVVNALPTEDISTTTIYFLKPAGATTYDEYVYINNAWVKIGTTDLDLSQYVTNDALTLRLADYYTKAEIATLLTDYAQKADVYDKDAVDDLLDAKQDTLTFDNVPTTGSNNPVISGGIKTALDTKQDSLTFDNTPTEDSANVVKSGGVYSAVNDVYKVIGENGTKNLLPNTATSKTQNGVTFTVNNDGSITVNGTATNNTVLYIYDELSVPNGSYKISANASLSMDLQVVIDSGSYGGTRKATVVSDSEVLFNVNNETLYTYVWVRNGTTINNVTIYPMLRSAFDTDSTYQPYAMTNRKLTEESLAKKDGLITIKRTTTDLNSDAVVGTWRKISATEVYVDIEFSTYNAILEATDYLVFSGASGAVTRHIGTNLIVSSSNNTITIQSAGANVGYESGSTLSQYKIIGNLVPSSRVVAATEMYSFTGTIQGTFTYE